MSSTVAASTWELRRPQNRRAPQTSGSSSKMTSLMSASCVSRAAASLGASSASRARGTGASTSGKSQKTGGDSRVGRSLSRCAPEPSMRPRHTAGTRSNVSHDAWRESTRRALARVAPVAPANPRLSALTDRPLNKFLIRPLIPPQACRRRAMQGGAELALPFPGLGEAAAELQQGRTRAERGR